LYKQYPNPEGSYLRKIQTKVKEIATFSPPLFHGRGIFQYSFGFVPFRKPVHAVGEFITVLNQPCTVLSIDHQFFSYLVGKPIHIDAKTDPSIEEIDDLHKLYLEGLEDIFETHKDKFGIDKEKHLEFI
jgi:hypothetical protein